VRRSGEHGNGYRHPCPNQENAEDGEQAHLPRTATSHTKPRIKHPVSLAGPCPGVQEPDQAGADRFKLIQLLGQPPQEWVI
jgi:hypothetical protein